MNLRIQHQDSQVTLFVEGSINTQTAPQFQKAVDDSLNGSKDLVIDLEKVDYVSSAGLRVLLAAADRLDGQGSLKVIHISPAVKEVFDMTGFSGILGLE